MRLKPATEQQRAQALAALRLLCSARDLLRRADSPKTLERTRAAISSAKGAIRHLSRRVRAGGAS